MQNKKKWNFLLYWFLCSRIDRIALNLFGLLFILISSNAGYGQWTKIFSEKLDSSFQSKTVGGILSYQKGMLLYGFGDTLRISKDNGITWQKTVPDSEGHTIYDIDFLDKLHGVIGDDQGGRGILYTSDGGISWSSNSEASKNSFTSVRFLNLPEDVFSIGGGEPALYLNSAQVPLTSQYNNNAVSSFGQVRNQNKIYFHGGSEDQIPTFGHLYEASWNGNVSVLPGNTDFDCYSFGIDTCNENLIAVVNEETYGPTDGIAGIYVSTDGGNTFGFYNQTRDRRYYCGSLSIAPGGVIFVQTTRDGILRSIDNGQTWMSIGGPNGLLDSRLVSAVTPDLIYAADDTGAVWMTTNSGGFPTGVEYTRFETLDSISTDTIGGDIFIPITIESQSLSRDVELNIYFNNNRNLKYNGTFSTTGASLDIPGTTTSQTSQILIPASIIKTGNVVAISHFNLFADTILTSAVRFDLMQGTSQQVQCANTTFETILTGPSGCGTEILSAFLHTGIALKISSIHPNPSQDEIELDLQSATKQDAVIEIYDALGAKVFSNMRNIVVGSNALHLDTRGLSDGIYFVRLEEMSQSFVKVR